MQAKHRYVYSFVTTNLISNLNNRTDRWHRLFKTTHMNIVNNPYEPYDRGLKHSYGSLWTNYTCHLFCCLGLKAGRNLRLVMCSRVSKLTGRAWPQLTCVTESTLFTVRGKSRLALCGWRGPVPLRLTQSPLLMRESVTWNIGMFATF